MAYGFWYLKENGTKDHRSRNTDDDEEEEEDDDDDDDDD